MRTSRVLAYTTVAANGVVMIAATWRWAFAGASYHLLDIVTLAVLMLGFISGAATVMIALGSDRVRAAAPRFEEDALALFPTEQTSAASDSIQLAWSNPRDSKVAGA